MGKNLKIEAGSRVAIIGGGPAGVFFALYLLHYAGERGIRPEITIYEQRKFDELGAKGCKGCAGILSLSFVKNLSQLGLNVPEEIIQSKIARYTVHSPYTSISISNPERGAQIASIYRGGGPRISHYENRISFDGWLLREAQKRGIKVESQTVSHIYLEQGAKIGIADKHLECELIVLATGVNAKQVTVSGLEYTPPPRHTMAQTELYAGASQVKSHLGNDAHVFLIPHSRLIFGTLVPKGPFISVSVLSRGDHPMSVEEFLNDDMVRNLLPKDYEQACDCRPKVVVGSARNYYADRFVAIGDAAVSRLYKDGIGSSLLTAREAARTVVHHGFSRRDFQRHYQPLCRSISRDNRWGQLLFLINDRVKNSRTSLLSQNRLIGNEQANIRGPQPFTKAVWGMFTGSYSYRNIAWMTLNPASVIKLSTASLLEGLKGLSHRDIAHHRRLYVGSRKIIILGSGFGGTYVFRHLLPSLNRNENVETTMISDENFFLFSPLLHEVAMGRIETRHVAFPIRRLQWRDRFNFIQASVQRIDLSARKVFTTIGVFEFDYLVLALGSITDTSALESDEENVFKLKTLRDSMLIRNHIIAVFERAIAEKDTDQQKKLLTFVVCGAGYVGVQVVTELRDFIYKHLIKFYRTIDPGNIKIILVEAEPKILAGVQVRLGAYAMRQLEHMGIEVKLNSRITSVRNSHIEVNRTEQIPTSTLIWVAGIVANPRVAELDVKKDRIGRVLVNQYLEVPGVTGVYALGDCAHYEDQRTGQPIPPRAHTAVRQAKVVSHNILAELRGRDKIPYIYSNNAELVSLGASKAVFRFYNLRIYGFLARLIWVAGYSSLVTGTYNRIRIITDWGLSLIFGRDTTFLKLTK